MGHYSFTILSSVNTQIHYKERTCCSFTSTASEEFVRSFRHPWLLSLGKLCKDFRDKLQLIVKMHGEDFQGFKNINTVRLCYFFSFLNGLGSMTIPSPKRWWEGSGFVKSPCFPQGVSVTDMDTRHVPLKIDMLQIL